MIIQVPNPYAYALGPIKIYQIHFEREGVAVTCDGDPECKAGMYFWDCGPLVAGTRIQNLGWTLTDAAYAQGPVYCPRHAPCQPDVLGSDPLARSWGVGTGPAPDSGPDATTDAPTPEVKR